MAGGTTKAEIFCVPPLIVKGVLKQGEEAAGHTVTIQVLPEGVIAVFEGTFKLNPAEPLRAPGPDAGSVVFLLNGRPFQKYCAEGFDGEG